MAKAKAKTSKSAKVREVLTTNPNKPVAEVAKEVGVTPGLVYNVKAKMNTGGKKKSRRRRKPGRKTAAPLAAHNALDTAFEFVSKVGGLLHAEQLIDKLKAIKERL
jgi:transposase-like protein